MECRDRGENSGEIGGVSLEFDKLFEKLCDDQCLNQIDDDLFVLCLVLNDAIPDFFETTLDQSVDETEILDDDLASVVCHQDWENFGVHHHPSEDEWQQWYVYLGINLEQIQSKQHHVRRNRVFGIYRKYIDYIENGITFDANWDKIRCEIIEILIFGSSLSHQYFEAIVGQMDTNENLIDQFKQVKNIFQRLGCGEQITKYHMKYFQMVEGDSEIDFVLSFINEYFV